MLHWPGGRQSGYMPAHDTFTAQVPQLIIEDAAFSEWENSLDGSLLVRIQAARDKIETIGVVTNAKDLGDGMFEKKWRSGLRLYFAVVEIEQRKTLLLLGSGKGRDQSRAIEHARGALQKYKVIKESIRKKD